MTQSSFTSSFCFLPRSKRTAMQALYNFCRHVDDIVDDNPDKKQAEQELEKWCDEIDKLYAGKPRHPISQALLPAVETFSLPQNLFEEIIDGMAMDLKHSRYKRFKDLELYCYRAAATVGQLTACILGYQNHQTMKYAYNLGISLQLINIIRDVGEDATRGRIYLPTDELIRFKINPQTILKREEAEGFQKLMQFQAQRARDYYDEAMKKLPQVDRSKQKVGLLMANVYLQLLNAIEKQKFPVLKQKLRLKPSAKIAIMLMTYCRELFTPLALQK